MKITFEDGSFLELEPLENGSVRLVLCGIKEYNKATMSIADLTSDQVTELFLFLHHLEEKKEQDFT